MPDDLVRVEIDGGIAKIRLNRPDRLNALDFALGEQLLEALLRAERAAGVKCVQFTGEGRAFMAGGDLALFHRVPEKASEEAGRLIELFHQVIRCIRRMRAPVLVGVQGAIAGGGLGLALACDLVVAASDATFVPAYTRIGTSPDGGTTWSITRLIGHRRAMEWIMLGDPMGAEEAQRIGLINRVVAAEQLGAEVDALARRLADGAGFAIASVKRLVHQAATAPLDVQLESERDSFVAAAQTADFREGIAAFFEKRQAKFAAE